MTEPFTENELHIWCDSLDFRRIERQLEAASRPFRDNAYYLKYVHRSTALNFLAVIYEMVERGDYDRARSEMNRMNAFLRETFKWEGWRGEKLPKPLDKRYVSQLYWEASRALKGVTKPRPESDGDWKRFNQHQRGKGWSQYSYRAV